MICTVLLNGKENNIIAAVELTPCTAVIIKVNLQKYTVMINGIFMGNPANLAYPDIWYPTPNMLPGSFNESY